MYDKIHYKKKLKKKKELKLKKNKENRGNLILEILVQSIRLILEILSHRIRIKSTLYFLSVALNDSRILFLKYGHGYYFSYKLQQIPLGYRLNLAIIGLRLSL